MEGFTVALALVDAIPVLAFAASMGILAARFDSPVFMVGAGLSILAGCCKVAWKLILGIWKKNVAWLNKPFVPMQATGFVLMFSSFLLGIKRIPWANVWAAVTGLPSVVFFLGWLGLMGFMVWYRKNRFRKDDAKSNWTAQLANAAGQLSLLLGLLLA